MYDRREKIFIINFNLTQFRKFNPEIINKCIAENYDRKAKFASREIQEVINDLILKNTTEFEYIITNKNIETDNLEILYLNETYKVIKIQP